MPKKEYVNKLFKPVTFEVELDTWELDMLEKRSVAEDMSLHDFCQMTLSSVAIMQLSQDLENKFNKHKKVKKNAKRT